MGPKNLASEEAVVVDGVLAPKGPAFKALIVYQQTQITPDASSALLRFAKHGLPIYIVGTIPNTTVGATGQQQVSMNINNLLGYKNVRVLDSKDFSATKLAADGVRARAQMDGTTNASDLYTFWTTDVKSRSEYVYLYNQGAQGVFNVTFNVGAGLVPYALNSWTGSQVAMAVYEKTSSAIRIPVELKSNQTTIIAFKPASTAQRKVNVISHSSNVKAAYFMEDGSLEVLTSDSSSASLSLSNGKNISLPKGNTRSADTTNLGPWNLTVQAYGPIIDHATVDANITTINVGMLDQLIPWTKIPGIEHTSGIGTYRTHFDISTDKTTSITVDFGPVLHTAKAWLNGKQGPAIDPTNPVVDISNLVKNGSNFIEIQVTTSLFNAVKANIDSVLSIGAGPTNASFYTGQDWQEFGLVGPVKLKTLRRIPVELSS